MCRLLVIFLLVFSFPVLASATVHYVASDGSDTWANSTAIETPCSLATANTNATAGDIVYLRGGTYTNQTIEPDKSGTTTNKITWQAYTGETPILDDTGEAEGIPYAYGILLDNKDWHVFNGLEVRNQERTIVFLNGSSFNEIVNCTIHDSLYGTPPLIWIYDANGDNGGCNHNWIHGNTIYNGGRINPDNCLDDGGCIQVATSDYISNYTTIENNIIYHGGHYIIQMNSMYNVIRNNIIANDAFMEDNTENCDPVTDPWPDNGKWGNRNLVINDGNNRTTGIWNLIERNRIGYGSNPPDGAGAEGITITGSYNIIRYNYLYHHGEKSIYFKQITNGDSDNNKVYNNTIYHYGYSYRFVNATFAAVVLNANSDGNVLKNNLSYDRNPDTSSPPWEVEDYNGEDGNTLINNWWHDDGDPLFTDTDITNYRSLTKPELYLLSNSPCIDSGVTLTQTASSGTTTTLMVDDASYFQDGTWGSGLATLNADWVAVGTVTNVAQISAINYSLNKIILTSAITFSDNSEVWLYKDSEGDIVLYGTAPDQGAHEYVSGLNNTQSSGKYNASGCSMKYNASGLH